MNLRRSSLIALLAVLMAACGSNSLAPKPAPLPTVQDKITLLEKWHKSLDKADGVRLQPALSGDVLAAISAEKSLSLLDANTGAERWKVTLPNPAAGGVGLSDDLVVAGTLKGEVLAFGMDGKPRWKAQISSEVVAPPILAGSVVLVRGNDGRLTALAADTGAAIWNFLRQQPALQLRNFAPPLIVGDVVYYGQAGGRLVALNLKDGRVLWEAQVAQPRGASEIERMADVVSLPAADESLACAVAYQGRLACFNALNGSLVWSRDVSSWAGLAMDKKAVYVVDDKSFVAAYERSGGRNLWRQEKLAIRDVSGPAIVGKTLALGDYQGYLHFMDIEDGSFVAQKATDGGAIVVAPQVFGDHWLVQTQKGGLYILGPK